MHTVWWSELVRRPAIESRVREGHMRERERERERESTVREGNKGEGNRGRTAHPRAVL